MATFDNLHALPIELWLIIFRLAVGPSLPLVVSDPFNAFLDSDAVLPLDADTKRALVSVCRAWRVASLPLMYEHIVMKRDPCSSLLLQTLSQSSGESSSDLEFVISSTAIKFIPSFLAKFTGYGQWTRRIDVSYEAGRRSRHFLPTLLLILHHCPNLRVLTTHWRKRLPWAFHCAVTRACGPSLEQLSWNEVNESSILPQDELCKFLSAFRAIRILDIRQCGPLPRMPYPTEDKIVFGTVECLIVSMRPRSLLFANRLTLPANERLIMDITPIPGRHQGGITRQIHMLATLLEKRVHNYTTVEITTSDDKFWNAEAVAALTAFMRVANSVQAIKIEKLVLPLFIVDDTFSNPSDYLKPLHSVRYLGLRVIHPAAAAAGRLELFPHKFFTDDKLVSKYFIGLETIRTLDAGIGKGPNVSISALPTLIHAAQRLFTDNHVRLEDMYGVSWTTMATEVLSSR